MNIKKLNTLEHGKTHDYVDDEFFCLKYSQESFHNSTSKCIYLDLSL